MKNKLIVANHICEVVDHLQQSGYEAYVVGGAIRDLMLGRIPKDYDISTSATPIEVRNAFGRRIARIIGKRFKLVHLSHGGDLLEISTFRRPPESTGQLPGKKRAAVPENMIFEDNDFGTAEEDAWRRDFTVNALFYDPIKHDLIDYTGYGIEDMQNCVVRAIGDPHIRFEEDPVRMLRALKLVGQYNFTMETATANALRDCLPLISHASQSRLSLELEKILQGTSAHKILATFHEYGFLEYFLPFFEKHWNTPFMEYSLRLLAERNRRVAEKLYRNSISLAMGLMALPFVEAELGSGECGKLWEFNPETDRVRKIIMDAFYPHNMIKRLVISAQQLLTIQPRFFEQHQPERLMHHPGYMHARELMIIQNELVWQSEELTKQWPAISFSRRKPSHHRPRRPRHRGPKPDTNTGNAVQN
ncbi:MAG: hypothetical protein WC071_01780 [Victivallaceae bacterium]